MVLPIAVAHPSSLLCSIQFGQHTHSVAGHMSGFQFMVKSSAAVNIIRCVFW